VAKSYQVHLTTIHYSTLTLSHSQNPVKTFTLSESGAEKKQLTVQQFNVMDSLFVPLHRSVASSSTCSRSDPRKQFHFLRNLPNVSFLRSRVSLPLHDLDLKKEEVSERSSRIVCAVSSTETRYTFYFIVCSLTYMKAFSLSWLSVWLLEKTKLPEEVRVC
jgi:hypothetical protein